MQAHDHELQAVHEAATASGTYPGHILGGLLLLIWGLWWLVEAVRHRRHGTSPRALEGTWLVPILKLMVVPLVVWLEMPGSGWYPMDRVMGWVHIWIYVGFGFSGMVDILHRLGRLSPQATRLAFAGAALNTAFLLGTHGNHLAVEYAAHLLLAATFGALGLVALAEGLGPRMGLHWLRIWAIMTVGAWLVMTGWILFRAGWDLQDGIRVLWVFPYYSGTALLTATVVVLVASVVQPFRATTNKQSPDNHGLVPPSR